MKDLKGLTAVYVCLAALALLALISAGCASIKAGTGATPQETTLTAVKTEAAIEVDGQPDEQAWDRAPVTTIKLGAEPGVEARAVELRALYNDDSFYLAAAYKDATPLKIGEAWIFDGTNWEKGPYDDTLAFVWNMDGSVKGFNDAGLKVMTTPLEKGLDVYDFAIDLDESAYSSIKDTGQEADVWGWCGMPEFYGKADDLHLAINPAYQKSATGIEPVISVGHDAFTNEKPWIKNETSLDGRLVPAYRYKEGLNITNTPRPYLKDVEIISDYASFKPGDRAPYVIGVEGATWGGSKDDIDTKGANDGRTWTVEFARRLDTGNDDDILFVPGKNAVFVTVVRDDGKGYAVSSPVILRFE